MAGSRKGLAGMRDAQGRFRPYRTFRLMYDDRPPEVVREYTPSRAVERRAGAPFTRLPFAVIDLTAMRMFMQPRAQRAPLLDRLWPNWREEWWSGAFS